MSRRNMIWLGLVVALFFVGWLAAGLVVGIIVAVAILVVSEVVERVRRRRIAAASGTEVPSIRSAVTSQRRRPGSR